MATERDLSREIDGGTDQPENSDRQPDTIPGFNAREFMDQENARDAAEEATSRARARQMEAESLGRVEVNKYAIDRKPLSYFAWIRERDKQITEKELQKIEAEKAAMETMLQDKLAQIDRELEKSRFERDDCLRTVDQLENRAHDLGQAITSADLSDREKDSLHRKLLIAEGNLSRQRTALESAIFSAEMAEETLGWEKAMTRQAFSDAILSLRKQSTRFTIKKQLQGLDTGGHAFDISKVDSAQLRSLGTHAQIIMANDSLDYISAYEKARQSAFERAAAEIDIPEEIDELTGGEETPPPAAPVAAPAPATETTTAPTKVPEGTFDDTPTITETAKESITNKINEIQANLKNNEDKSKAVEKEIKTLLGDKYSSYSMNLFSLDYLPKDVKAKVIALEKRKEELSNQWYQLKEREDLAFEELKNIDISPTTEDEEEEQLKIVPEQVEISKSKLQELLDKGMPKKEAEQLLADTARAASGENEKEAGETKPEMTPGEKSMQAEKENAAARYEGRKRLEQTQKTINQEWEQTYTKDETAKEAERTKQKEADEELAAEESYNAEQAARPFELQDHDWAKSREEYASTKGEEMEKIKQTNEADEKIAAEAWAEEKKNLLYHEGDAVKVKLGDGRFVDAKISSINRSKTGVAVVELFDKHQPNERLGEINYEDMVYEQEEWQQKPFSGTSPKPEKEVQQFAPNIQEALAGIDRIKSTEQKDDAYVVLVLQLINRLKKVSDDSLRSQISAIIPKISDQKKHDDMETVLSMILF
ncbi:TPA: hypothetical protein DIV45_01770 [Patescibacteria group bacterium]|nr:hypothetical protein [Patescibacteria group bacterium]